MMLDGGNLRYLRKDVWMRQDLHLSALAVGGDGIWLPRSTRLPIAKVARKNVPKCLSGT